eukprot:scaffold323_cov414-Prasinococcus_capsulatus_cf.AAC.61
MVGYNHLLADTSHKILSVVPLNVLILSEVLAHNDGPATVLLSLPLLLPRTLFRPLSILLAVPLAAGRVVRLRGRPGRHPARASQSPASTPNARPPARPALVSAPRAARSGPIYPVAPGAAPASARASARAGGRQPAVDGRVLRKVCPRPRGGSTAGWHDEGWPRACMRTAGLDGWMDGWVDARTHGWKASEAVLSAPCVHACIQGAP